MIATAALITSLIALVGVCLLITRSFQQDEIIRELHGLVNLIGKHSDLVDQASRRRGGLL